MKSGEWNSLLGKKFGRLVVVGYNDTDKFGRIIWDCICDCGTICTAPGCVLRNGKKTSCGCIPKEIFSKNRRVCKSDLLGKKFGRLTVVGMSHINKHRSIVWDCDCDCGNKNKVSSHTLLCGNTRSCGCLATEIRRNQKTGLTHGLSRKDKIHTRLFKLWIGMKARCYNKNVEQYRRYGGRGIYICDEWHDYKKFHDWSIENGYRDNLSIERIDNDNGYNPDNCTWIPFNDQAHNRSTTKLYEYKGELVSIRMLSTLSGISYANIHNRINNLKWTVDDAVNKPINNKNKKINQERSK